MVLCISSQSYRKPLLGQIACAFQATVKALQEECKKKKEKEVEKRRERHREKSWREAYEYTSLRSPWKALEP